MKNLKRILLASHGTVGALEAEKEALLLCAENASIFHLIVVPDFWKGMVGNDWLHHPTGSDDYDTYVESQLEKEIRQQIVRLENAANKKKIKYSFEVVVGDPAELLVETANSGKFDISVIGSPRPRGKKGLRSRMDLDQIARDLDIPILIVPFPETT
ncbi:MAG: universal stress protein [Acidiferrobacterales bacterium]|jgi:nucleotide-binding universal stress UspA family protein|nr:universal stress protein [Acidiferrobacterales bacterium]